jgi:hypothetical protein
MQVRTLKLNQGIILIKICISNLRDLSRGIRCKTIVQIEQFFRYPDKCFKMRNIYPILLNLAIDDWSVIVWMMALMMWLGIW